MAILILLKKLIDYAKKDANFEAVKFQKRDINLVYTKEYLDLTEKSPLGTTQRQQKEGLEFANKNIKSLDEYCK